MNYEHFLSNFGHFLSQFTIIRMIYSIFKRHFFNEPLWIQYSHFRFFSYLVIKNRTWFFFVFENRSLLYLSSSFVLFRCNDVIKEHFIRYHGVFLQIFMHFWCRNRFFLCTSHADLYAIHCVFVLSLTRWTCNLRVNFLLILQYE